MILRTAFCIYLFSASAMSDDRSDIGFAEAESLPPEVWEALANEKDLAVETRLNPFYLQGDFDGDSRRDTAVLVKRKDGGKAGVALVLGRGRVAIAGAGNSVGNGGDDFGWVDAWRVERQGVLPEGLKAKGDALLVMKTESGGGQLWWDGKALRWHQQGD